MKTKIPFLTVVLFSVFLSNAQTISIVGTGVNGWPDMATGPEIVLSTTDNISYSIAHLAVSNGTIKFRKDQSWTTNWGGSTFPNGTGILNGPDIATIAGTYDVTFNISNATYTFIPSASFPQIGIWGPAVDAQNGYVGADVDMTTTDGINYTLSGFYFTSGQAYFRQDNATNFVWGSTTYPNGTAILSGPSLFIPGGEHFVTFNRITGDYSFAFPSVGILGTSLSGYDSEDIDLQTTDGFYYSISQLHLTAGTVKFRKDNLWTVNWGGVDFPNGTGVQDGTNIPIPATADYDITFDRLSGIYAFDQLLSSEKFILQKMKVYPNPATDSWQFSNADEKISSIQIIDALWKNILTFESSGTEVTVNATAFSSGIYFAKVATASATQIVKLVKQ